MSHRICPISKTKCDCPGAGACPLEDEAVVALHELAELVLHQVDFAEAQRALAEAARARAVAR